MGLTWTSIGFAVMATAFWWASSSVALHPRRRGYGLGGHGSAAEQLSDTLRRQSAWNSAAAGMAGVAALLQALSLAIAQVS